MKLENVLKLEKYCEKHDDSYCFTKDHDSLSGLTCQNCIHGNELVERLLERAEMFREARDLYSKKMKDLLEALKLISDTMAQPKDRISVITLESYEKIRLSVQDIIKQARTKAEDKA